MEEYIGKVWYIPLETGAHVMYCAKVDDGELYLVDFYDTLVTRPVEGMRLASADELAKEAKLFLMDISTEFE